MESKPKLSFEDLYNKIKKRGITFNKHTKEEVIEILRTKSYYYRLLSYRKNFRQDINGNYIGLDFEALLDLSSIDTYLREFLLSLTLDIEHAVKTLLMAHITNSDEQDGYQIIKRFQELHPEHYNKTLIQFQSNKYKTDMFNKRKEISLWVFLEIIDFGTLILLIEDYFLVDETLKNKLPFGLLRYVKNIRNACAHNDVFLINIFNSWIIKRPTIRIRHFFQDISLKSKDAKHIKIHDIVATIMLHKKLCSDALVKRRYLAGVNVLNRMSRNKNLYLHSKDFNKFYAILCKIIAFLQN